MWTGYVIYYSMMLGYLLAFTFLKKIPSISYGLFVVLLLILFPTYGLLVDLFVIGKYAVLESKNYTFSYLMIIANHIAAFLFGFTLSSLLTSRIQNFGDSKWFKILCYIPPLSILTIVMRLPKGTQPKFMLTRVNATLFIVGIFTIQYVTYLSSQKAWDVELNYLTNERASYAEEIVNQIEKMEDIPYPYAKGFFWVTELSANNGTISFVLVENKKGSADWEDEKFLKWLDVELCFQQDVANRNRRHLLRVDIEFEVKDFDGNIRWKNTTTYDSCDELEAIKTI